MPTSRYKISPTGLSPKEGNPDELIVEKDSLLPDLSSFNSAPSTNKIPKYMIKESDYSATHPLEQVK